MMGLTHRERDLLAFLTRFIAENNGAAPSFDEMREYLGLQAKSGVYRILTALEERGHIVRMRNRARAIEIVHQQRSELSQFSDADIAAEYARRFIPAFQIPSGRNEGKPVEAHPLASTGHQMPAASTPGGSGRRGSLPVLSEHHFVG